METYVMFFMSAVLGILGFFIVRFFKSVDAIIRKLDAIELRLSLREENIREIKDDVHEIRVKQQEHGKRLYDIEFQLAKNKQ
jgi:hypothetical protein